MHATASVERGADGTTGIHTGEEHDLSVFKRMLLGAVTAMVVVAVLAVGSASATTPPPRAPTGTVPTEGYATRRTPTCRISPGGASTSASSAATRDRVPGAAGDGRRWMLEDPLELIPCFQLPHGSSTSVKIVGMAASRRPGSRRRPASHSSSSSSHARAATDVFEKQFIVGWMEFLKPTVAGGGDVNAGDFCSKPASTRSRRSRSGCSGRTRTAGTDPLDRSAAPHQHHRQGQPPARGRLQRVGPRRPSLTLPDDWGKWAAVVARSTNDHDRRRRDDELGHPRRLAD